MEGFHHYFSLTGFSPNFTSMKLFIHWGSIIMDSIQNPIILVRWIYLTAGLVWTSQHRRRLCWDVGGKCDSSRQRYCWHFPVSSWCLTYIIFLSYQLCYRAFTLIKYNMAILLSCKKIDLDKIARSLIFSSFQQLNFSNWFVSI